MSLRTSPQTGVAIRSPFDTAPGDRNYSKGETDCHGSQVSLAMTVVTGKRLFLLEKPADYSSFITMTVVKRKFLLLLEPSADFPLS